VVGSERLTESGSFRATIAQENLIKAGPIPYSIVRATQFFEFVKSIARAASSGMVVRLPPALIQPIAADDVVSAIDRVAAGSPINGVVEVAGPERFRLDGPIRIGLAAQGDSREVISDPEARYFGATLQEATLLPGDGARLASTRFEEWAGQTMAG
jgi:uncharacterized protein YbjT (DUF2867 family)